MQQAVCKSCGSTLLEKATKRTASQLQKSYYYSAYYWCPKCQKLYHDEKFKVVNDVRVPKVSSIPNVSQVAQVPQVSQARPHSSPLLSGEGKIGQVDIWTDGACVFNGQPNAKAAWAFVSGDVEQAGLVPGAKQTNNVAEGLAIYHALLWAAGQKHKRVKLHTDSQISLHNLGKDPSQVKLNQEIFQMIADVIRANDLHVTYVKVLGHSGDPNNERADKLANNLAAK